MTPELKFKIIFNIVCILILLSIKRLTKKEPKPYEKPKMFDISMVLVMILTAKVIWFLYMAYYGAHS